MTCKTPEEIEGQNLRQIKDLNCDNSNLSLVAIISIIASILVFLIFISVAIYWYCHGFSCGDSEIRKRRKLKRPKSLNSKQDIVHIPIQDYDSTNLKDVENIYQSLEELPLGSSANYPDVKTTVL